MQEDWDNAGLQIGLTAAEASGALLCLDVNEGIVDEAIEKGCNIVVSHHPLIFRGLKQITGADYVQWITGTGTLIHPLEGQCAYPTP